MTDAVAISIINGIFSISAVIIGLVIKKRVTTVHKQINSRMDEMLEMNKKSSRAEGNLEGRAQQDLENKARL